MKAYLTFVRKKENDVHMLGVDNPINICDILFIELKSGQPIISVIQNNKLIAFYILDVEGNLYQLLGDIDYLFDLNEMTDLSLINLKKYNLIKYFVSHVFQCLSIQEAKHYSEIFELLEEKIFYNLLHIEISLYRIKLSIAKEIVKSELSDELKVRLLASLKQTKSPNKKILKKKIDVDLSGYGIKINALVQ
jgi:hypothetical protein